MVPRMSRVGRSGWAALLLPLGGLLLLGVAEQARAQDAQTEGEGEAEATEEAAEATEGEAEAEVEAEGEASEEAEGETEPAEAPAQPAEPEPPATLDPPPPPPIMVVVLPERRVPEETSQAAGAFVESHLAELAGRREVHLLAAPQILEAVTACEEDTCYGGILEEAGAAAGVIVRMSRRGVRYPTTIELRDPVSGTLRGEVVEVDVPRNTEPAEALTPVMEQVQAQMPAPPPPDPTLLVTVNVDGADVSIDGISIGISPVAPVTVASGFHNVQVTMDGYLSVQRRTQVAPGDTGRVDVTLDPMSPEQVAANAQTDEGGGSDVFERPITEEWWFWTLIGGGAVLVIGAAIIIGMVAAQGDDTNAMLPTGVPLPRIEGGMF